MTIFYLVRHAHADWNPDENRPLSARGQQDALLLADRLLNMSIDLIYSSPYQRARQTVEPLAGHLGLPVNLEINLRERELGQTPEGDFQDIVGRNWRDMDFTYPKGESNRMAQARGRAVLDRLRLEYPAAHIVISTHGNLLALMMHSFNPELNYHFWLDLSMPDVYILAISQTGAVDINRYWKP
jgi:2,3-bisphosphoglycerate-dependent phosphoglycerate mutase